jgi:hypothetical protein
MTAVIRYHKAHQAKHTSSAFGLAVYSSSLKQPSKPLWVSGEYSRHLPASSYSTDELIMAASPAHSSAWLASCLNPFLLSIFPLAIPSPTLYTGYSSSELYNNGHLPLAHHCYLAAQAIATLLRKTITTPRVHNQPVFPFSPSKSSGGFTRHFAVRFYPYCTSRRLPLWFRAW